MRFSRYDHNFTAYTLTQDANGFFLGKTTLYASFDADIQPISKSPARLVEFGLDSTSSASKILYYDTDYTLPKSTVLNDNNTGLVYQCISAQLPWDGHHEIILEPYNGAV